MFESSAAEERIKSLIVHYYVGTKLALNHIAVRKFRAFVFNEAAASRAIYSSTLLLSPALHFLKVNHLPKLSGILMPHK